MKANHENRYHETPPGFIPTPYVAILLYMTTTIEQRGILWLKLSSDAQANLRAAYPPMYSDTYYDHVTLLFDVRRKEVAAHIGQHAEVAVYAHANNDDIEAVRVTSSLPDTYGVPHITLSARPGITAFASVAMLHGDHDETARPAPLLLDGIIEFVPLVA